MSCSIPNFFRSVSLSVAKHKIWGSSFAWVGIMSYVLHPIPRYNPKEDSAFFVVPGRTPGAGEVRAPPRRATGRIPPPPIPRASPSLPILFFVSRNIRSIRSETPDLASPPSFPRNPSKRVLRPFTTCTSRADHHLIIYDPVIGTIFEFQPVPSFNFY